MEPLSDMASGLAVITGLRIVFAAGWLEARFRDENEQRTSSQDSERAVGGRCAMWFEATNSVYNARQPGNEHDKLENAAKMGTRAAIHSTHRNLVRSRHKGCLSFFANEKLWERPSLLVRSWKSLNARGSSGRKRELELGPRTRGSALTVRWRLAR